MKQVVVFALVACSAPATSTPTPATPAPQRDLAIAEPPPKQPAPPEQELDPYGDARILRATEPRRNDLIVQRRGPAQPQEIDVAARDLWSPCVRDFVRTQPDHVRRALTAAFARYPTSCDANQRIAIEAPRDYRDRYVVLRGALTALTFDVVTCGITPSGSVEIVHDNKRWTGLATSEQVAGCTVTSVPDMRSLRRVLRDVLDAKDVVARVDAIDVVITDEMKRDLRLMLDALDALSAR